ncbi:MAG: hypothetical protein AAF961_03020 [Planctomycetota bacterium]
MKRLFPVCLALALTSGLATAADSQPPSAGPAVISASYDIRQKASSPKSRKSATLATGVEDGQVRAACYCNAAVVSRLIERDKARADDFVPLSELHRFPHLRQLTFPYGSKVSGDELAELSRLPGIVHIEMGFAPIDSEYVTLEGGTSPLGRFKDLEVLRLCKDGIHDADLRFVAQLSRLRTLEFNADNGRDDAPVCTDKCAELLCRAKQLRHVAIWDGQFTDRFVAALVSGLPKLETLQLNSDGFTDAALKSIATHGKNLRKVVIASDQFTAAGANVLDTLSNLEVVSVRSTALRDR